LALVWAGLLAQRRAETAAITATLAEAAQSGRAGERETVTIMR
jgi:hypothetical protein